MTPTAILAPEPADLARFYGSRHFFTRKLARLWVSRHFLADPAGSSGHFNADVGTFLGAGEFLEAKKVAHRACVVLIAFVAPSWRAGASAVGAVVMRIVARRALL